MNQTEQFQRHDLVWLSAQAWESVVAAQPPHQMHLQDVFQHWQQQEWPAIVRRRDASAAADEVCIGFALPPKEGYKPKVAATVKTAHILEHQSALSLNSVIQAAPATWQETLRQLQIEASVAGIRFRVYGSLAMQFLTGQTYIGASSDVDLLFRPQDREHLVTGLALLVQYQKLMALDGEIIFPQDQAVAWKEWLLSDSVLDPDSHQKVLVKDMQQVRLMEKRDLILTLAMSGS